MSCKINAKRYNQSITKETLSHAHVNKMKISLYIHTVHACISVDLLRGWQRCRHFNCVRIRATERHPRQT